MKTDLKVPAQLSVITSSHGEQGRVGQEQDRVSPTTRQTPYRMKQRDYSWFKNDRSGYFRIDPQLTVFVVSKDDEVGLGGIDQDGKVLT